MNKTDLHILTENCAQGTSGSEKSALGVLSVCCHWM